MPLYSFLLVTYPMSEFEAGVDLVLKHTSRFSHEKHVEEILVSTRTMLITHQPNKAWIKTSLTQAMFPPTTTALSSELLWTQASKFLPSKKRACAIGRHTSATQFQTILGSHDFLSLNFLALTRSSASMSGTDQLGVLKP